MSIERKYLRHVKEFLCRLRIPDVVERMDDDDFIAEKVFPIANEQFVDDYYRYAPRIIISATESSMRTKITTHFIQVFN